MSVAVIHSNIVTSAEVTATSENTDYPVSNLKTDVPAEVFKSLAGNFQIDVEFQEVVNVSGIALVNHDFQTGTTLHLNYSSDGFQTYESFLIPINNNGIIYIYNNMTASSFQIAVNSPAPVSLGGLVFGTFAELPAPDSPVLKTPQEHYYTHKNEFGQKLTKQLSRTFKYQLKFSHVANEDYLNIVDYFRPGAQKVMILGDVVLQGDSVQEITAEEDLNYNRFTVVFESNPLSLEV